MAVLPLLHAAEHSQPKRGVLGEELVQVLQPHASLPVHVPRACLSLQTTQTGRTLSLQTTMSLTRNKTCGGRRLGDKLNLLDTFFLKLIV